MKNLLKLASASLLALALTGISYAVPIYGGVSLAGNFSVDTANVNTANAFTSFSSVQVTGTSFDFNGVTLNTAGSVTMNVFSFDPFPVGGVTPLWSESTAGKNVSFDLLTVELTQPGDNTLKLVGTGLFSMDGFDATAGTFLFTANQALGTFSFSLSQETTSVPDGGTTALLLGLGLIGASVVARRNKAA